MLTGSRVEAGIRQPEPFHWFAADDVRFDDLLDIGFGDVPVPDGVWIDNEVGAVLALVEAARLIGAHSSFQSTLGQFLFEKFLQLRLGQRIAASPRMARWALVSAHEDMFFELRHQATVAT